MATTIKAKAISKSGKQYGNADAKITVRQDLLHDAAPGACYVPFIGAGDLAAELYEGRPIYGADLDADRLVIAQKRLPTARLQQSNCDQFPFRGEAISWAVADFDSYSYPYASFRAFWRAGQTNLVSPFVCFFTDAQRQAIVRGTAGFKLPSGKTAKLNTATRGELDKTYFESIVKPWFEAMIKPWQVDRIEQRHHRFMIYWGAVISKPQNAEQRIPERPVRKIKLRATGARAGFYKFDETKRSAYLELIRSGRGRCVAARTVGMTPGGVSHFLGDHADFAAEVSKMEMEATEGVENALYETALTGNVVAQQVWLYNRNPDRWTDRRSVEHSGPGGGPVQVQVDERILIAKLERLLLDVPQKETEAARGNGHVGQGANA